MKKFLLLLMAVVMVGCTFTRTEVKLNQRLKEIDEAAARGDITEIQRQELKNDALKVLKKGDD